MCDHVMVLMNVTLFKNFIIQRPCVYFGAYGPIIYIFKPISSVSGVFEFTAGKNSSYL